MYKLSALSILALVLAASPAARAEVQVGKPAPNVAVHDITGKALQLSDYKGKTVVVENYNLDCPYVANHYKRGAMQKLQADATSQGVVWLVVNSSYSGPDRLKQELASQKLKAAAVVYDPKGAIGRTYGFKTTPHMLVIDPSGLLAYSGAIDDKADPEHDPLAARNYVREALQKLGAGQALAVTQTKPYGCGVKYAQ